MAFLFAVIGQGWTLLLESSIYILFGLLVSGLLKVFLDPSSVARHFAGGRFFSVVKAAFLGIPIPLCSCGVLPAAASLKKQGANKGATTAFLISTPESGVDSIAISYALLDPIMTIARPLFAFITATSAGFAVNTLAAEEETKTTEPDLTCAVDACCDGKDCPPKEHRRHHSLPEKVSAGIRYAFFEVWGDLANWYLVGLILAGLITALIPEEILGGYLGSGWSSMLIMLAVSIPLYICATASTPIAAALILKGVSPGAALVFLLAGPATNITSLTVLLRILGKRATFLYLVTIIVSSVLFGLILDYFYVGFGFSPQAIIGQAAELVPAWAQWAGALFLLSISLNPVFTKIRGLFSFMKTNHPSDLSEPDPLSGDTESCVGSS
jgi:uncharacterized membrane protein YraQ (UPF0718 family)